MFNFSASITVNHVGRNFHVFGKKKSFVSASWNPGCWSGRSGCGAPGMGGASRSVSHPSTSTPSTFWEFPKIVVPQNGWFIMEKLIKMDDLGVPLFSETSFSTFFFGVWISLNLCRSGRWNFGCSKVRIFSSLELLSWRIPGVCWEPVLPRRQGLAAALLPTLPQRSGNWTWWGGWGLGCAGGTWWDNELEEKECENACWFMFVGLLQSLKRWSFCMRFPATQIFHFEVTIGPCDLWHSAVDIYMLVHIIHISYYLIYL